MQETACLASSMKSSTTSTKTSISPAAPQVLADLGIGPAQLVELRWEDIVIETYDNVGIPNWANEAWMGFSAVDANGIPLDLWYSHFQTPSKVALSAPRADRWTFHHAGFVL